MDPTASALRRILADYTPRNLNDSSLAPAGVMVLVYPKNGEHCVLLNKRSEDVEDHKGEISFPGGRKDDTDATLLETALREIHEEMGILPDDIDVLGQLDEVATNSNYVIAPFVGTIPPGYSFAPSEREVAEVLEVPVRWLADRRNARNESRLFEGTVAQSPAFAYQGNLIFGATARVLRGFIDLVDREPSENPLWKN